MALSVSLNVKRRNLTKSQTAIAAAQTWILAGARKGDRRKFGDTFGVSQDYVTQARALIDRAPDLADAVKAGTMPLADAYEELRGRERASQKRDQVLAELRGTAPDLADAVKAGTMPLADAYASAPASRRRGGSSSAGC